MQYTENLTLKLPEEGDTSLVRTDMNYNWAILDAIVISSMMHRMMIQDIKAASLTGIHAAITGNSATQDIATEISNPDEARNPTITTTNNAAPSGDVVISGLVRGVADTETLTIIPGSTVKGNKPFDTVTNIRIPAGVSGADTVSVGFGDKVGLVYEISAITKVYKVEINSVDVTSTYADKVNATYSTIDFSTISAYQDIKIFYRED